jgi:hypothetical protein
LDTRVALIEWRSADRVEHDQMTAADAPHRLEAAQRVAEHLEHIAHHDEVELAVDAQPVGDEMAYRCTPRGFAAASEMLSTS